MNHNSKVPTVVDWVVTMPVSVERIPLKEVSHLNQQTGPSKRKVDDKELPLPMKMRDRQLNHHTVSSRKPQTPTRCFGCGGWGYKRMACSQRQEHTFLKAGRRVTVGSQAGSKSQGSKPVEAGADAGEPRAKSGSAV